MSLLPRIFTPRTIGQRFALAIGAGAAAIFIVMAAANYLNGRELLLGQASREALREAHDEIGNWDDLIDRLAMLPMAIAAKQVAEEKSGGVTVQGLASLLAHSPIKAVYGVYMILDDQDWKKTETFLFVDRKTWPGPQRLNYDFHDDAHDWYRGAKEKKGIYVTQPFFAEGGSEIEMISITQPVYNREGKFVGVAGVDVALDEMKQLVKEMHRRDFGTEMFGNTDAGSSGLAKRMLSGNLREAAYLISPTGAVIFGPKNDSHRRVPKPGEENPDRILGGLQENGLTLDPAHLKEILSEKTGWLRVREGGDKVICWAESRTTGWKIILAIPYRLIVTPARNLAIESVGIGAIGLILLLGVIIFIARKVSGPIRELQSVTAHFEKGSYGENDGVLERIGRRRDELGRFAKSFSAMVREIRLREERLSLWNSNLEATVRQRTADLAEAMSVVKKTNAAMAAELSEAAAYARAVLPPRLSGKVSTEWAFETSSQLGGDSFGYHWIDDDHLALYLLDVCGHGVGAALLSVSVVNLLRTASLTETDFLNPSSVLSSLNETFPMERHNDMYFTAWYGVYTHSSRLLRFACGGHPPAVLVTREGSATRLSAEGMVVGAFPKVAYATAAVSVPEGSRLYLFSDGAYEIDRPDAKMMTYEDFVDIASSPGSTSKLAAIVAEIKRQQGGDSFADDFSLVEFLFESELPSRT